MNMILSILIPTTPDRRDLYWKLIDELMRQMKELYPESRPIGFMPPEPKIGVQGHSVGEIEIISYEDNKEISVGKKRDMLYQMAHGEYSVQWDSDDWIAQDGLERIMKALKQDPDCVTYRESTVIDGVYAPSNHSIKYADWEGDGHFTLDDGFVYHRTPFMKSVIRTDYCRHIGVMDVRFGEDHDFAKMIKPMLIKEVHIDEEIYFYRHVSSPHNERYGIKE